LSSLAENSTAKFDMASIQGYVTRKLDLLLSVNRNVGKQAVTGLPYAVYTFTKVGSDFQITPQYFSGMATISAVSAIWSEGADGYNFKFGMSTDYAQIFDQNFVQYVFSEKDA
jgi:hypothetical protein